MKQSFFSTIALTSLLILAGAGCLTAGPANNDASSGAFAGSLNEAIESGQALKCTWTTDEGSGTTYMKDGNMFAETTFDDLTGYVITDGNCSYIWQDGKTDGVQICMEEDFSDDVSNMEQDVEDYSDTGLDYDVQVDCNRTAISDDQFTPPSDINFINPLDLFNF